MDWNSWVAIPASVIAGAVLALAGSYFWVRRNLSKVRKEEDDTVVGGWRELMEYKSEDFRKKNVEQDARFANMRAEMDKMHAAHLKCERDGMEREMSYQRAAMDREAVVKHLESRLADMTGQIESLQVQVSAISTKQSISEIKEQEIKP